MNDQQLLRYSRHVLLDEFGTEAQEILLRSHALIIGAGGLGCPAALYLAAAGVGQLTLADADSVDLTNLQRQILHGTADVGRPKVASAQDALARLNPEVTIQTLAVRAEGELLHRLVAQADVVLDCSDNFATRHAVNRVCVALKKPLVSGAGIRFDGQVAVFDARLADSPCYECLFPEQAEPEEVRCAVMGVFSPLTGIIGCMQAAEAIKCLTGIGRSLAGRLLLFDALRTEWRSIRVPRDPQCSVCGAAT